MLEEAKKLASGVGNLSLNNSDSLVIPACVYKKTEQTLNITLQRFYNCLSEMRGAILLVSENNQIEFANQSFCDYFGFTESPSDLKGWTANEILARIANVYGDPDVELKRIRDIVKAGKPVAGQEVSLNGNRTCLRDFIPLYQNGESLSRLWHHIDITERKKAEEALRESEKLYHTLFDNSEDGFMLLEPIFNKSDRVCDFVFLQLNAAYEHLTGAKAVDVLGKRASQVTPELETQITQISGDVVKTGKSVHNEDYNKYSDKWYDSYYFPYSKGKVGILFRDVTQRKKAEEALLEAKTKYEQLVDKLPEMVFELNSKGIVTFANLRALDLLGYSVEELKEGFDANHFVAPEDIERSKKNMKAMLCGRMRHKNEYLFIRKDGSKFPVLLTSSPIIEKGKVVGARGVAIDLSERKENERRLKDNERMVAIGQTAAMVGHDIRNPLQAIVSELFLARSSVNEANRGDITGEALESIEFIQSQVDYINKIVSDLQDFARPLNPEPSIIELIQEIQKVIDTISLPENIKLTIDADKAFHLSTDPAFIRRMLTNLINNAIQAMPKGGDLKVSAKKKIDGKVLISVQDTGDGIPDDIKPKLFTPMVTTKSKGQGLGLAVVKRLVEALNGNITFESEVGKGTKFIIELPTNQ